MKARQRPTSAKQRNPAGGRKGRTGKAGTGSTATAQGSDETRGQNQGSRSTRGEGVRAGRSGDPTRLITERRILQDCLATRQALATEVGRVRRRALISNPTGQDTLGLYRAATSRKAVIADLELLSQFQKAKIPTPAFLEAGPRSQLAFDPRTVRAAVVTTGGLAPGLHCVIHSIVNRHCATYGIGAAKGRVFGVYDSFQGLSALADNMIELNPDMTENWLDQGGSNLGIVRYFPGGKGSKAIGEMADSISENLRQNNIHILYVIGGDGSLKTAHAIAERNPTRSIIGIPKTMDNDILWVWQSFGFDTAVEQATRVINTLTSEAEATRRICVIELFGADSGFVAANASLASGHVDLVLIPELFKPLSSQQAEEYLESVVEHLERAVEDERHNPHAIVVVAEGVAQVLEKLQVKLGRLEVSRETFIAQFCQRIERSVLDAHGKPVPVFVNQPRHHVRAVAANAHDQIYCERLGALAVDNALAGYTDCMVSQWLTEFVLVPLELVTAGQKSVPVKGMFWKQVLSSTGQPLSPAEVV